MPDHSTRWVYGHLPDDRFEMYERQLRADGYTHRGRPGTACRVDDVVCVWAASAASAACPRHGHAGDEIPDHAALAAARAEALVRATAGLLAVRAELAATRYTVAAADEAELIALVDQALAGADPLPAPPAPDGRAAAAALAEAREVVGRVRHGVMTGAVVGDGFRLVAHADALADNLTFVDNRLAAVAAGLPADPPPAQSVALVRAEDHHAVVEQLEAARAELAATLQSAHRLVPGATTVTAAFAHLEKQLADLTAQTAALTDRLAAVEALTAADLAVARRFFPDAASVAEMADRMADRLEREQAEHVALVEAVKALAPQAPSPADAPAAVRDARVRLDRLAEALAWAVGFIRCHHPRAEAEYPDMHNAVDLTAGGKGASGEFHRACARAEVAEDARDHLLQAARKVLARMHDTVCTPAVAAERAPLLAEFEAAVARAEGRDRDPAPVVPGPGPEVNRRAVTLECVAEEPATHAGGLPPTSSGRPPWRRSCGPPTRN